MIWIKMLDRIIIVGILLTGYYWLTQEQDKFEEYIKMDLSTKECSRSGKGIVCPQMGTAVIVFERGQ